MVFSVPKGFPEFNELLTGHTQSILVALKFPYDSMKFQISMLPHHYQALQDHAAEENVPLSAKEILHQKKLISTDFSPEVKQQLEDHIRELPLDVQKLFAFQRGESSQHGTRYRLVIKSVLATDTESVFQSVEKISASERALSQAGTVLMATGKIMKRVGYALPSGITGAFGLVTGEVGHQLTQRRVRKEVSSSKDWVLQEGNRLVKEFNGVKAALQEGLKEALKNESSPTKRAEIREGYKKEGARLKNFYQEKIDEVKNATSQKAAELQANQEQRKVARVIQVVGTGVAIGANFFPPLHLGLLITGAMTAGMALGGNQYIANTAAANHGVRMDSMLMLSSKSSVARALLKSEKVAHPTVVLMPKVIDPCSSIRLLSQRLDLSIRRLDGHTEFVLKLPHTIKELGPNAKFSEIQREYLMLQENMKYCQEFMKKLDQAYPHGYQPEIINLKALQKQMRQECLQLDKRANNKLLGYEKRADKAERAENLRVMKAQINHIIQQNDSPLNQKPNRVQPSQWNDRSIAQYLDNTEKQLAKQIKCVTQLADGLKNKAINNEVALLDELRERVKAIGDMSITSNTLMQRRDQVVASLNEKIEGLEAKLEALRTNSLTASVTQISDQEIDEFESIAHVEFAPGVPEGMGNGDVGVVAHRYKNSSEMHHDISKDLHKVAAAQRKGKVDHVYIIPYAKYDDRDAKVTHNSKRLNDYARGVQREIDWAVDFSQKCQPKPSNLEKLKQHYQEQIERLESRLETLQVKTGYDSKSSNALYRLFNNTRNSMQNRMYYDDAKRTLTAMKECLAKLEVPSLKSDPKAKQSVKPTSGLTTAKKESGSNRDVLINELHDKFSEKSTKAKSPTPQTSAPGQEHTSEWRPK